MKKWLWKRSWQGISFQDLDIQVTRFKRPASCFYEEFYKALLQKYASFDELPSSWKKHKVDTARYVAKTIARDANVLSIGAALGFVENSFAATGQSFFIFRHR